MSNYLEAAPALHNKSLGRVTISVGKFNDLYDLLSEVDMKTKELQELANEIKRYKVDVDFILKQIRE